MDSRCRVLPWDSEFFGRRIARLTGPHLRDGEMPNIVAWCRSERIKCLYFLAASDDAETLAAAQRNGFAWMDSRVTYERKSAAPLESVLVDSVKIRPHREADIPALEQIARGAHTDSRFFFDAHFDRTRAAELYACWIRQACANDHVVVAESASKPVGYLSCTSAGEIGLVGVTNEWQGRGVGRALLAQGLRWFSAQGLDEICVVTQGRNVAAHRFYQNAGFRTRSVECWFHKWLDA